jgi:hypothetical protein
MTEIDMTQGGRDSGIVLCLSLIPEGSRSCAVVLWWLPGVEVVKVLLPSAAADAQALFDSQVTQHAGMMMIIIMMVVITIIAIMRMTWMMMMMTPRPPLLQAGSTKDAVLTRGQSAGQSAANALLDQRANDGSSAKADFPGEISSSSFIITTTTVIIIIIIIIIMTTAAMCCLSCPVQARTRRACGGPPRPSTSPPWTPSGPR